ncbi:MAG: Transposase [Leptospirillum sp. Group II 'C75']|uniref:Transposase n=2 Tax=Leptospirillum sp. Group II '5-way CG' TaxID=419541 RepID=B6AQV8_9BACT|nr:IS66 family transposase [Leptospirillum sp. Group II 'CF-1']EDZ38521.1 MAG: Transposase [Leptospirillum sp. Group II '5-way CG']EIJ75959.1 MAG: Transposase [Leptospirillum sp. Group II 'C75']
MDDLSFQRDNLVQLARTDPERVVDLFLARLSALEEAVRLLRAENQELKARLNKDSHNSHKPPSSDGYRKPSPKSLRTPSGKKSGGQPGHSGETLLRTDSPDHVVDLTVGFCPCGEDLSDAVSHTYESRQVFDLPEPRLEVTEYRLHKASCPRCGKTITASAPEGVTAPTQYGLRFKAALAYLHQEQSLPLNRVRQLCSDLFGAVASEATTLEACRTLAGHLSPFRNHVAHLLIRAPFPHADETGLRVDRGLHWTHVASTGRVTLYGLHPKRGKEGIESLGVVNRAQGTVVHDFWGPYLGYPGEHAFCNAHLLRELTAVEENDHHAWAPSISAFLLESKALAEDASFRSTESLNTTRLALFHDLLDRGWEEAGRPPLRPNGKRAKATPAQNLLRRLEDYSRQVLAFFLHPGTPFTNNQAEQDLRMIKVRQKVSGCFRTPDGAQVFLAIRSYTSTLRKQGRDVWAGLTQAMQGRPFLPSDA